MYKSFLIKYAEIAIKGKNRYLFEDALVSQINHALKKAEGELLLPDIPVILAGDFNAEPGAWEIQKIERESDYVNLTKGIGVIFHGFLPEEVEESIDYVYLHNSEKENVEKLKCTTVEKWEDKEGNVWLSDHYPVCVNLEWC